MMKSVASIVVGLVMVLTAVLAWTDAPQPTVGEVPEPAVPEPLVPESVVPERDVTDPVYEDPIEFNPQIDADAASEGEDADPPRGSDPRRLTIPRIGVDNTVVEVGLNPDGSMEIPDDVRDIGWYTPTQVRPGDEGSAVMAGHVDSRTQGPGAFFDLQSLDVGDAITVTTADGDQVWEVTGRTQYDKDYLPIEEIFTTDGDPRLVLITCGGPFDSDTRHYTENTVVYASQVP